MPIRAYGSDSDGMASISTDVRIEDYLNDKLQTSTDLEYLDSLLENVQARQNVLKQQLEEAVKTLDEVNTASQIHSEKVLQQAERFQKHQADIDRRLLIVTRSETSDDAVRKFESSMDKLHRLDIAQQYMETLREVDNLCAEARRNFRASPQAALTPYIRLRKLATALDEAQPAAEGAAPHLVDSVHHAAVDLWKQMKDSFAAEFEATLAEIKWPSKDLKIKGNLQQQWAAAVEKLLDLQNPEMEAHVHSANGSIYTREAVVLLPLEVMVKPLELRFQYHFNTNRPTNRLDKPEYFLAHFIGLLNTYEEFFAVYLQPILQGHFIGLGLAHNPLYTDSTSAFITALLPVLRRKVFALLPQLSKQPQLLSHFMHELMSFDATLKDEWGYDGAGGADSWKGMAWEVLVKHDWFPNWLQVEKEFALTRYQSIIDNPESGEIDYDEVELGTTKPTKAAIRVNDLLETITDRYRPLPSFSQKLRFLIDIQIAIFDRFHSRLNSSLEAYLTLTSSIARTVQGVSADQASQLQGLGGLERLCRVYGSAEYLEKKMRDWSDDVFFLDLWEELQDRARNNISGKGLAGPMSLEDVAGRTSEKVGSQEDSGALFDETAAAYKRTRIRSEGLIQDLILHNIRETLRPYGRINPWSSLTSEAADASSLTLTAELDTTVQQLTLYLSFLEQVLAQAPLRRISRQLMLMIQNFLWDHVLMRNTFSAPGVAQFSRDVSAIQEVADRHVGEGQGQLGMRKLTEALRLLSLPLETDEDTGDGERSLKLLEVEQRMFVSNESGREVLDALSFEALSEIEARHVLERRLELGS